MATNQCEQLMNDRIQFESNFGDIRKTLFNTLKYN